MAELSKIPPVSTEVILLPSDRFFVRVVALAAEGGPAAQVELALEGLSPFPAAQLYHGCLLSPKWDHALVYAAYRKRFSAEETAAWNDAVAVLPAFLSMLGDSPAKAVIRLGTEPQGLVAVAWDGRSALPVAVIARETVAPAEPAGRDALVAEIRARTGLADAPVQELSGAPVVNFDVARGLLDVGRGAVPAKATLGLRQAAIEQADVRDKGFLAERRVAQRRDVLIWRSFQACLAGLAAMVVLEAGLLGGGVWLKTLKATVQGQASPVQRIETAQSLSVRIEEMTKRRLMPFEMLALINRNRPASVQFIRSTSTGLYSLEIEAQTATATDVDQYEAVLRAAPELTKIETRDLRSREGVTSFVLTVTFKPEALHGEAGS